MVKKHETQPKACYVYLYCDCICLFVLKLRSHWELTESDRVYGWTLPQCNFHIHLALFSGSLQMSRAIFNTWGEVIETWLQVFGGTSSFNWRVAAQHLPKNAFCLKLWTNSQKDWKEQTEQTVRCWSPKRGLQYNTYMTYTPYKKTQDFCKPGSCGASKASLWSFFNSALFASKFSGMNGFVFDMFYLWSCKINIIIIFGYHMIWYDTTWINWCRWFHLIPMKGSPTLGRLHHLL